MSLEREIEVPNGREVSEEELRRKSRALAVWLSSRLPKGIGFALMLFHFGGEGHFAWISNAQRSDMMEQLREFFDKNDGWGSQVEGSGILARIRNRLVGGSEECVAVDRLELMAELKKSLAREANLLKRVAELESKRRRR